MKSENINELAKALLSFQGDLKPVATNQGNTFFNHPYADLNSIWEAVRLPLHENGLSVVQTVQGQGHDWFLVTTLCHTSGQWLEGSIPLILTKSDMQGLGSAITYARRYGIAAILGISQYDDDADRAVGRGPQPQPKPNPPAPARQAAAPARKRAGPVIAQPDRQVHEPCNEVMLVSRFNPNEVYCPACKFKEPRSA